jgi:uncharacterized protein (TIGR00369 family)
MTCQISADMANRFLRETFVGNGPQNEVIATALDYVQMRIEVSNAHLRPGNYISGPTQMALADSAAYIAVMTRIGIVPMAVTSSLNINFLRPCLGTALLADARTLKFGQRLAVIEVSLCGEDQDKMASHAVVTYTLPQETS